DLGARAPSCTRRRGAERRHRGANARARGRESRGEILPGDPTRSLCKDRRMRDVLDDLLHEATKKLDTGAPKQALRALDKARELAPDDTDVLALRGRALVDLGQIDEARVDLERAASGDPPSASALIELG